MSTTLWIKLISYAVDLLKKLGEVVARSDQVVEVQEKLLDGIAKRCSVEYRKKERVRKSGVQSALTTIQEMLAHVKGLKRNDNESRFVRAFVSQNFTKAGLDSFQGEAGIPLQERVA
jgi:hypothetical protein